METIYAYMDYRKYLRDWFEGKKRANPRYSLKILAGKAGFRARDYLYRVMHGTRNLSLAGIGKVSAAMSLGEKQAEYFQYLVQFNQAANTLEKEVFFRKLESVRRYGAHEKLRKEQFEVYATWYHGVVRALADRADFGDDMAALAGSLDPEITPKQAEDSVNLLLRLGLLEKGPQGRYRAVQGAVSTGDEVLSLAVAAFHKATMDLAKRSIGLHPSRNRDISGLTMSVSKGGFLAVKKELQSFRKRIMALAMQDKDEDRVYQLNFHLFPLTKIRD